MSTCKSVYQVLYPVYFVSKICGFSSISIKQKGFSVSIYGYVYPVVVLLLLSISLFYDMFTKKSLDHDVLYSVMDSLLNIETALTTLITSIAEIINTPKLIKWIEEVDKVDKKLAELKIYIPRNDSIKMTLFSTFTSILFFSASLFILVVDILCFYPSDIAGVFSNITYSSPIFVSNLLSLRFTSLLLVLHRRFKCVNDGIKIWKSRFNENLSKDPTDYSKKFYTLYFNEKQLLYLEELRIKHYQLHTLSQKLMKMFALPLLFTFLQIFMTFQVYSLYFIKLPSTKFAQKTTKLYQFFGKGVILINALQLVTLSVAGSLISLEAHKTGSLLNNVKSVSEDIDEYVKYFVCQLLHNEVQITACDIFVIRTSLIFQVASSLTSYLVLCIQLHI